MLVLLLDWLLLGWLGNSMESWLGSERWFVTILNILKKIRVIYLFSDLIPFWLVSLLAWAGQKLLWKITTKYNHIFGTYTGCGIHIYSAMKRLSNYSARAFRSTKFTCRPYSNLIGWYPSPKSFVQPQFGLRRGQKAKSIWKTLSPQ